MAGYGRLNDDDLIKGLDMRLLTKSGLWGVYNHYRETGERSRTLKMWMLINLVIIGPMVILSVLGPFYIEPTLEGMTVNLLNPMAVIQIVMKCYTMWYGMEYQCRLLDLMKRNCLTRLPPENKEKVDEILGEAAKQANFLAKMGAMANIITSGVWAVIPILRSEYFRLTLGFTYFGTPVGINKIFGFWYPVDITVSPWAEIVFLYEATAATWACFIITLQEATIAQTVTLLTAQIKVFNYLINDLKLTSDHQNNADVLLEHIKDHQTLMKFGDEIMELYNWLITMTLATAQIILIISIFNFILGSGNGDVVLMVKFIVYTLYPLVEVAMYCNCGDNLETVSGETTSAAYGSEWYRAGPNYRKTVQMIMVRSQNTLNLKAAKLYPVNLMTLSNMLQMSYSTSMLLFRLNSEVPQ